MKEKKGFVTIGHGKTEMQTFIRTLLKYKVNCIVDVRSSPYSKYSPQYNREAFEAELSKHKISYKWFGKALGGRPEDLMTYDEEGIVDYEKLVKSKLFLDGLQQLEILSVANNIAIMCSEQDPIKCHRFLAISRELYARDYRIVHIMNFNCIVKQSDLEDKLIKIHFGENVQLDLFSDNEDNLSKSYSKQNKLCAYRRKSK